MLDNRKVAGILVQLVNGRAIAGIGINVNHPAFPPELANEAISLRRHAGRKLSREKILTALFPAIDAVAGEDTETILRLFTHASSYAAGRRVTVHQPGGDIVGTTAGLDPAGFLIVRKDDGTDTLILAGGVRASGS
jgi:BirA family biotin operon repressor/biotin-[acetyl-CoA-carboxylase] ligase